MFLAKRALVAAVFATSLGGAYFVAPLTGPAMAVDDTCYDTVSSSGANASYYGICSAPTGTGASDNRWDTTGFVGLSVPIDGGFHPHLDVGIRETNVNSDNFVWGLEQNVSISLLTGLRDTQVRFLGVAGTADLGGTDLLGNAGVGWDIGKQQMLLNAGVQVPYARAFLDYTISDRALRAFLEVNSYGKIQQVQNTLSCGAGTVLENGTQINQQLASSAPFLGTASGDIFTGTLGADTYNGTPSTTNFVNNQTCFKFTGANVI